MARPWEERTSGVPVPVVEEAKDVTLGSSRGTEPREGVPRAPHAKVLEVIEIPLSFKATTMPEKEGGLALLAFDISSKPCLVGPKSAGPSSSMAPTPRMARGLALMSPDTLIILDAGLVERLL